jgi:hypothetical protein
MPKVTLSDAAMSALAACYATRGKHKGKLLAKCPPSQTLAAAAWQGATLSCNPYKASIASMLFMTPEQRAIRDEVLAYFDDVKARRLDDRDRAALERLGVW